MKLIALSINHRTSTVELRETLHLSEQEIIDNISLLKNGILKEGLIISTCNRTEIYGLPFNNISNDDLRKFLLQRKNVSAENSNIFENYFSSEALKHLFRVITGLDSLLIGDNQIFKQVKDSFRIADEQKFSGFLMKKIFSAAVKTGKRAISETEISSGAVTISYAAVQLIEKIFSNLNKKSALVIGVGETGEIAAKHLADKGIGELTVTNRTFDKAAKLAENLNSRILPYTKYKEHLYEFDIIISATSSPNLLITKDDIAGAMKKRNYSSMVLMDIAIPRDIDPNCKSIDYVFYHDIDSLNIIVEQNLLKRKKEIPKVEKIIDEEVTAFMQWYKSLEAAPTIKNLRDHFEKIRAEEVSKNINKFSEEDREKLEIISKRIINKILHQPTVNLKKLTENSEDSNDSLNAIDSLRELFGMNDNNYNEDNQNNLKE